MKILLLGIIYIFFSTPAYSGTTFTQLSKSVEIVDMDKWVKAKLEADEYARKQGAMVWCSSQEVQQP